MHYSVESPDLDILLGRLDRLTSHHAILVEMKAIVRDLGFQRFALIRVPRDRSFKLESDTLLSYWQPARSDERAMVLLAAQTNLVSSIVPVVLPGSDDDKEADPAWQGVCLPVSTASGQRGALFLFGPQRSVSRLQLACLQHLALFLNERLQQISTDADTRLRGDLLSERQRDCLYWTAKGKTSEDIAVILGVSVHTVNSHVSSGARILGASSRAHAVAQALRLKLIE